MSAGIAFGRLQDVAVREAWTHEAPGFSPWLAGNLEHVASEVAVTQFAADILTQNVTDDPHADYLLVNTFNGGYAAEGDRDCLIVWLDAQTQLYAAAITDIVGETS